MIYSGEAVLSCKLSSLWSADILPSSETRQSRKLAATQEKRGHGQGVCGLAVAYRKGVLRYI